MNKQDISILNEIHRLIEERNALIADKAALIDALRSCVTACDHCANKYNKPCDVQPGHEMDCITCTDSCPCRDCKAGSGFKWVGRYVPGKHAAPNHLLPVGVQMAMNERKTKEKRKRADNDERKQVNAVHPRS